MKDLILIQIFGICSMIGIFTYTSSCEVANSQETQKEMIDQSILDSVIVTEEIQLPEDEVKIEFDKEPVGNVVDHVKWQSTQHVTYDPSYRVISYPNGDVAANKGVCIDVVIRAFRSINVDFQKLIHEDMDSNMSAYGVLKTDTNIDHRRCKNAIKYFRRINKTVPITNNESDYMPGDIVFWDIALGHVGVVTDIKVPGTNRYYMVHNICCGPQLEDFLFSAKIVEHVRWD